MAHMKTHTRAAAALFITAMAILPGCAPKGPILLDVAYQVPKKHAAQAERTAIAVSPFKDERGKTDSVAGRRFSSLSDAVNDLVVQGTVSERVTAAIKSSLKSRGVAATNNSGWDLTEAGIPADGSKLVIGGAVKTLWVEALSGFASTKVTAKVELRIVVADVEQKKIIRTLNVGSTIERSEVLYSTGFVQNTISEAVTTALDQVFNDEELRRFF